MIQIIPSISVKENKITRLRKGDYKREKIYKESPLEVAKKFEGYGIKMIHLVDLEGARQGSPINYHALEIIAGHTNLEIDFAGGLYTDGDVDKAFEYGATSITAATIACLDKELFASWIVSHSRERIRLGADVFHRKIAIQGWQKGTQVNVFDHIAYFYNRSLKYVKTTDIEKYGSLEGPSFDLYKELLIRFPNLCIISSGGVRSLEDIQKLEEIGVYGVIFGEAYYEGVIQLKALEKFLA